MKISRRNFLTAAALSAPAALIGTAHGASAADGDGRETLPVIQSADMTFRYA